MAKQQCTIILIIIGIALVILNGNVDARPKFIEPFPLEEVLSDYAYNNYDDSSNELVSVVLFDIEKRPAIFSGKYIYLYLNIIFLFYSYNIYLVLS